MKGKMKGWGEEVKASAREFSDKAKEYYGTRGKEFTREFGETARRGGQGIGHAIGVIFKAFFLFIAGTIAFALFVALISLLFSGVAWWPINNFLWTSSTQHFLAWATLILFVVVPLVGFITWIIRRILRTKSRNNYLGWTFGGLWALGWIAVVFFAASISKDFRRYRYTEEAVTIQQPANQKMIVTVSQPQLEYTGGFGWIGEDINGWDISEDTLRIGAVNFDVKLSPNNQYQVKVKRNSWGRTEAEAFDRAGKIRFDVMSRDSILDVGNGYAVDKDSKFRGQYVEVEILVPAGQKIRFDETVREKLNTIHVKVKRSGRKDRLTNLEINDGNGFEYRTGVDYTMGPNGELMGPGGEKVQKAAGTGDGYRYEPDQKDTTVKEKVKTDLEKELEEQKKKVKELEDKIKSGQPGTKASPVKTGRKSDSFAMGPSPVSSVTQWF